MVYITSYLRKTDIFSPDQWYLVPDQELENPDHFVIYFLAIIFVRIERKSFLKFLRIKVSDGSGGFLSSGSPSGSNSPDDWGRILLCWKSDGKFKGSVWWYWFPVQDPKNHKEPHSYCLYYFYLREEGYKSTAGEMSFRTSRWMLLKLEISDRNYTLNHTWSGTRYCLVVPIIVRLAEHLRHHFSVLFWKIILAGVYYNMHNIILC